MSVPPVRIGFMFERGQAGGAGTGGGRTPGRVLADRIVARDTRIRAEELGTVLDLQAWLGLHSVDPTDPFAKGIAGGAGRRAGSDGTPLVDEFAVREYAALRHQSEPTARAFLSDVADLEHRFPKLWAAVQALWLPVWQARKIVAACRELSQQAAALVDAEMAAVVAGLPWSRILTKLAAAIMTADPALAEKKRVQAKSARFVQLCRSEDGINTMIVRADQGDLVMVYALVDRLADILTLEGSTEPADERRATAFGLLAQPAMILEMLLRHAHDGTRPPSQPAARRRCHAAPTQTIPARNQVTTRRRRRRDGRRDRVDGDGSATDQPCRTEPSASRHQPTGATTGPGAEPPAWTADDYDEPDDPAPGRSPQHPRLLATTPPTQTDPGTTRPGLGPRTRRPRPTRHHNPPDRSGLRLDLPGLTDLLTQQGLRLPAPGWC